MSLTLYIANKNYSSWSLRPWVLMRHLGIAFEEHLCAFNSEDWQTIIDISPTRSVPCLVDGEITVWDSLAIIEYLADRHAGIWPEDPAARAFARSTASEMHSGFSALRSICTMNCAVRVTLKAPTLRLKQDWARIDQIWSEGLSLFGGPFLTGSEFTGLDAFFAPVVFRAQTYSPALSAVAESYVTHMLTLPAMVDWYEAALKEPWRDEPHEAELRAAGQITADYRHS